MTKSGGQFALVSPLQKLWETRPPLFTPVISKTYTSLELQLSKCSLESFRKGRPTLYVQLGKIRKSNGTNAMSSYDFLLRPRQCLRSIVMSMSVCLSVREDISGTTRAIFTKFIVHVAYVRGSVLRHVDDRPHRLSAGRG